MSNDSAGVCGRCRRQKLAVDGMEQCIFCVGSEPVSGGTIEEVKGVEFARRIDEAVAVDMEQMRASGLLVSERPLDQKRPVLATSQVYSAPKPVVGDPLGQIEALINAMPFPKTKQEFNAVERLRKAVKGIIEAREEK